MSDIMKEALDKHKEWRGKIEISLRASLDSKEALSLAYSPGVAAPCLEIEKNPKASFELTRRWNTVAVITDGTAVLGLGDIGPLAAMPVMEGKAALFKEFGDVDAIPICIDSKDVDEIVKNIVLMAGSFGGINLEDISAPRCFEIERQLIEKLDIPVFHDDQHGTAIVTLAALDNALRLIKTKKKEDIKIVLNGAGAAGIAIIDLLHHAGYKNIIACGRYGVIARGDTTLSQTHQDLAQRTNPNHETGLLADVMKGADVFIGVSVENCVTAEMVKSMADKPVIFAMANPIPEIMPDVALAAGAYIVGTGRSDLPNQINNVLAFPGIFRGALDAGAKEITMEMKVAAAKAIAEAVPDEALDVSFIMPNSFDKSVAMSVAKAVEACARK